MNGSTSVSPATYWLTWPLQFAELATQTFRGNGERVRDFHSLKKEIDDIKVTAAQRRLENIEADLKLLSDADKPAYRELKERLQNLVR